MKISRERKHKIRRRFFAAAIIILVLVSVLSVAIYKSRWKENKKNIALSVLTFLKNNDNKKGGRPQETVPVAPSPSIVVSPTSPTVTPGPTTVVSPTITPSPSTEVIPSATPSPSVAPDTSNGSSTEGTQVSKPVDENGSTPKTEPINKNYKEFFKNDLFIGDSITDELSSDDLLNEANVCSKLGLTLLKAKTQIDKAAISSPENIYVLLGLNDLTEETLTAENYVSQYTEVINYLKSKYPGSKIYVQSVLPVTAKATEKTPYLNNERIGEFNSALKNMASQESVAYVDLTTLVDINNTSSFESDGEHPNYKFHPIWLAYLENIVCKK